MPCRNTRSNLAGNNIAQFDDDVFTQLPMLDVLLDMHCCWYGLMHVQVGSQQHDDGRVCTAV